MSNIAKTRKVTILFTQTSTREVVNTTAQSWGELMSQISGDTHNKRFVVRENKNTLESTEAVLPVGDFVLFAYPKESKAGAARKPAKKAKKAVKKVAKKTAKKAAKRTPSVTQLQKEAGQVKNTIPNGRG